LGETNGRGDEGPSGKAGHSCKKPTQGGQNEPKKKGRGCTVLVVQKNKQRKTRSWKGSGGERETRQLPHLGFRKKKKKGCWVESGRSTWEKDGKRQGKLFLE